MVASTTALICVVDLQGRVLSANPALLDLTGYEPRDIVGRLIFDTLVIPEDLVPAQASLRQAALVGTAGQVEADWLDRHGGRLRIHMHSSVLRDQDGEPRAVAYVGTDVTQQRQLQTELRERAETDALTGLRNRAAMLSALQTALLPSPAHRGDQVGLLFCDLDGFKKVNDRHGHLVGDALLIDVGRRLLALTRPPQVVSRLGGDEFLILTPAATPTSITQLSDAIERDMRRPFRTRHGAITIGVSVGAALGHVGDDPTQLIEQADRHMYGVKTTARARTLRAV
ncbi:GGDEF domain-containing protein [Friedmanniella luteola]|uniref:GGDEF domain-containing protein n=1 Tax=Friedmanniella luteola TaxID=546871 RepID=UPI00156193B2|nr:GGDEF domain-containing protein [Friedmanniella luteola]